MKKLWLALGIVIGTLFVTPAVYAGNVEEIREVIRKEYVDVLSEEQLQKQTVQELVEQLDAYSTYMSAEEFQRFLNGIENRLVGVGIVLEESTNGAKIVSVLPKSPAEKNELQAGDEITHVDGQAIVGKSVQSIVTMVSGKEHTVVTLTIQRGEDSFRKTIERQEIHVPTVEKKMLGGNVGWIQLHSFGTDSSKELLKAMQFLQGADSWIVDLRNNGGGYVHAAQEVSGLFPQVSQAFQLRYQTGKPERHPVKKQSLQFKEPTALLINESSASASEMVAAAVKEQGEAKLYGQTTYGKGTMQTFFHLTNMDVLKLTTARFYSPAGKEIDVVGVQPTVETQKGEELQRAHSDLLMEKWASYKKMPSLHEVPTSKVFTVTMTNGMKWTEKVGDAVQLIELGGEAKPIHVKVKDQKTLTVTPHQPLIAGAEYVLVIHPEWISDAGKVVKQGVYVSITVQ